MSPAFQVKLLRVLQEREVTRVGGSRSLAVDTRVLAATHRDLREGIREGTFREDLYFRLAVIPLRIPPLRERRDDILPLARHFLAQMASGGAGSARFTPDAEEALLAHSFSGNVRELRNTVERGFVLAGGEAITVDAMMLPGADTRATSTSLTFQTLAERLDDATAEHVAEALERAGGKKLAAATLLGVERTTLYRLLKKLPNS